MTIRVLRIALVLMIVTAALKAGSPPQSQSSELAGTSWQLVKFQGSDNTTLVPDNKSKYTITFGTDGQVSARVDCNRGRSTWKSNTPNQLKFGSWSMTRAKCPPGSLHDQIVRDGASIRSYELKGGHLFLSVMEEGGTYELEPFGRSRSTRFGKQGN